MRVGRSRRSWVKNCVAVGLSGGFIEPLESTAIYIIQSSLRWLVTYFPDRDFAPQLATRFNALLEQLYLEIRDFNILHYVTNNRDDTDFWCAARHDLEVPESLSENLALWRHALPVADDLPREFLFNYWSYMLVLFGKRYFDGLVPPTAPCLSEADWNDYSTEMASHASPKPTGTTIRPKWPG
jgi:tryptophan halogenase